MINRSLLIILPAENFNEEEYLTTKRILEISGFKLFIASDANVLCVGKNGLKVRADVSFFNMNENNFAGIVFIGGSGVKKYWENQNLYKIQMGTTLLRIVPIHSRQPKSPLVPGYGYCSRPYINHAKYIWPFTLGFLPFTAKNTWWPTQSSGRFLWTKRLSVIRTLFLRRMYFLIFSSRFYPFPSVQ